jgi:hypothetical protein
MRALFSITLRHNLQANFNLFFEHIGTFASILGAVLTVFFSFGAKSAADSAKKASVATREQVARINTLSDLGSAGSLLDDVGRRIHTESWDIVIERASAIRLLIAPIVSNSEIHFSEDLEGRLLELVAQMKSLHQMATKLKLKKLKAANLASITEILEDQKETLILALAEIKILLGDQHG